MFESLTIQNFQAHKRIKVEFDPHITTIVGSSDVGKSAIIRALRWVATNAPNGDAFIRHGSKGSTVKLFVDGHVVTRRRSLKGATNEYLLDDNEYKAFGRTVPEPIEALINMGSTGWQQQHDAPFWFSESPGEVSRQLNAIVNLGIIDETLSGVAKTVNRARTSLEVAETNLTAAKADYDALSWVDGFNSDLLIVEGLDTTALWAEIGGLSKLTGAAMSLDVKSKAATALVEIGTVMESTGTEAIGTRRRLDGLIFLIETAQSYEQEVAPVPSFDAVETAYAAYAGAKEELDGLDALLRQVKAKKLDILQADKDIKSCLKAMPNQCHACGQSLPVTSTSKPRPR